MTRRFTAAAALLLFAFAPACARRTIGPPPEAPNLNEPALAIPADLDLVARVDVARLRAHFGAGIAGDLAARVLSAPSAEKDAATRRLVLELLGRAQTIWLGVRPGLAPELTDNVVVLRGDFASALPAELGGEPRWSAARDLGGALLRFERPPPALRAWPAVLYVRAPELAIWGSTAEIDALERSLERGEASSLRVPESGLFGLATRPALLAASLRRRSPTLSRLLDGAEKLEASADFDGSTLAASLDVGFDREDRAGAVAAAANALLDTLASERGRFGQAEVSALARVVSVRLRFAETELLRLLSSSP